ncbi:DNA-packaging protein [Victivallaceae bacterium BBE-744-WT-12]|uniref:DNA-packaging protein n=1 Tax=Victivallis lenta TaxID=2606640 RepID=A0A844G5E3_9BACT|nr:phage terminase large subunit [Victivallis lenta]MST97811.1 DNA-packaging protein [Victivallis lenta]
MDSAFRKTAAQQQALKLLGGGSRYVLLFGGSRSGKTFILVYALLVRALRAPGSRHAILRLHSNSVRQSVLMDTLPKVVRLAFPRLRLAESSRDQFVRLPNRSEIWFGGLDAGERADKILGKEFSTIYFNECSEIGYEAVNTALTRLAQKTALRNKAYFDCNPSGKSHWSYKLFVEKLDPESNRPVTFPRQYASMLLNPAANAENLPAGYLEETLAGLSDRQRARFLEGVWLDDLAGALWSQRTIDRSRVAEAPELDRIIVGVDPAVTGNASSDTTGIVTVGCSRDNHFYVLSDASCRGRPLEWAAAVNAEYDRFRADRVVGEVNNGGELVETVLRQLNLNLSYRAVRATRGKIARAEPVAALYEQGRVHHVGRFPELEEEMTGFTPSSPNSPDRLDALVWAVTILSERPAGPRLITA